MKFGKVENMVRAMNRKREQGEDINLRSHMHTEFQATPEELYRELKIDPRRTTVEQMFQTGDDWKWLMPEVIRDAILLGVRRIDFLPWLIAASSTEDSNRISRPLLDFSQMKPLKKRNPGATIDDDTVDIRDKFVKTEEVAKGIKFPYGYNRIKRLNIDLLPKYFMAVGLQINERDRKNVVDVLLTGDGGLDDNDQPVDETPVVIGVTDTLKGIQEVDYLRAVILMADAGKPPTTMVTNAVVMQRALTWPTFKAEAFGPKVETVLDVKIPIPTRLNAVPTKDVTGEQMILVCQDICVEEIISQPFMVETDKIIAKKIEEAYASMEKGYSIIWRSGRIVIDGTRAFNENQIPDWFYY